MFNLKDKKIAVFGLGVSGISALKLLRALGGEGFAINSGDPNLWGPKNKVDEVIPLNNCFDQGDTNLFHKIKEVDFLILSPGIPREHEICQFFLKNKKDVIGEIEFAYIVLKNLGSLSPIIGITGTNGKTTTTTFLGEVLTGCGRDVFVGGNIGIPFCDYALDVFKGRKKADDILLELSSFQLESVFEFKADIAIILNLYQNHGERYDNIEDYGHSKSLITNNFGENEYFIYSDQSEYVKKFAQTLKCKVIELSNEKPHFDIDIKNFKLPGIHNLVNLSFVIEVCRLLKLDMNKVSKAIGEFHGVHHRIEFVENHLGLAGIRVFNDAKSTNWDATITAVKAMNDFSEDVYLILGGKKRGHGDSVKPFFDELNKKVKFFYLIGEMSSEIEAEFKELKLDESRFFKAQTLEKVIAHMRSLHLKNGILLFSPAFPSFDQFDNYAQRGEKFIEFLGH